MSEKIEIEISVDSGGASQGLTGIKNTLADIGKTAAGFVVGQALTDLPAKLLGMAQAAADDEASMLRLETAVKNTNTSFGSAKKAIEDRIKSGQDLAFSDDETRNALTLLISETGSYEQGMQRLTAAQDLARGANISLESAAKLLGKTSDENTAALGRYGIAVKEGATAQDVLNQVDAKFGGQAAAFASTGAADMLKFKDQIGEAQEQLGAYLLPAIIAFTAALSTMLEVITSQVIPAIAGMVGAIATFVEPVAQLVEQYLGPLLAGLTAIAAVIVASFVPAAAAWVAAMIPVVAEHIALAAAAVVAYAPIIAGLAAIGITVALLYAAWQSNFLSIQDITKSVIDFVTPYVTTAIQTIQTIFETVWPIVSAVVDVAMTAISVYVSTYIAIVQTVIETALPIVQAVFETVFPIMQTIVETVMGVIATIVGTQIAAVQTVIQTTLDAINLIWGPFWDGLKSTVETVMGLGEGVVGLVTTGMGNIKSAISDVLTDIRDNVWSPIWNSFTGIVQGVVDTVLEIINGVIGGWNRFAGAFNSLPDITLGGGSFLGQDLPSLTIGFPNLPTFDYLGGGGSGGIGANQFLPGSVGGPGTPGGIINPGGAIQGPIGGWPEPPPGEVGSPISNAYVNPLAGLGNLSGGNMSHGGAMKGGDVYLDGHKVGRVIGWGQRRDAFALRDPAGA